ncbi:NAD(P)/FAD-dependent oxidoreductase [Marinomonas algarum]|uniref:FAD-binding oxidoreductase n=1 Tax=Marinomonas algarum TaxID=2883105 RepID=A0A9X1IMR4_9GAMM|nr:FAD-binding oxidoreductase [Marinomonas algarum]MCB5162324.1 FAD-binding oxidoreductase [Marinomonas algarum]
MTQCAEVTAIETGTRFAVIGAGVVGLCAALQAQRTGFHVTLIDSNEPGKSTSYGNAGYLATEVIDPLGTPDVLRAAPKLWLNPKGPICTPLKYATKAAPWYWRFLKASQAEPAQRGTQMIHQLNQAAVEAWRRTLSDIGAEHLLIKGGHLVVWENTKGLEEADRLIEKMRGYNIACEQVTGHALEQLEPELSASLSHAVFFPDIHRLSDPYQVCHALFNAFIQRGGDFITARVTALKPEQDQVNVDLMRNDGLTSTLRFDQVSVCGGVWSKSLLQQVGLDVPLEAERGYHVTFPDDQTRIHHTILSADRKLVLSPLGAGLRAVGMSEIGGVELPPIKKRFQVLREHTKGLLPKLFEKPDLKSSEWMGHRPSLPDSLPVIDQHPSFPRLSFAFGHQHLGITQAAITAELLMDKIQQKPETIPLDALRVDRF